MDRSSYELAKHVMQFLPRSDTETIAKAAKQRHDLQNWKLAAAEHVEKRYLLEVDVFISAPDQVQLSVEKFRFNGEHLGHWDFKNPQDAWLADVKFHANPTELRESHRAANFQEVYQVVSLPVVPRSDVDLRSSLRMEFLRNQNMDTALKIVQVAQKTFTRVVFDQFCANGVDLKVEDFLHDYTSHEMSLEHLVIYCFGLDNEKLVDIFGSLFLQKRSMPLRIEVYTVFFDKKTVEAFIDKWMNADVVCGAKKTFTWPWTLCCHGLGDKYNPVAGHIAHPNKRASIMLKHAVYEDEQNELSIVKFEPWVCFLLSSPYFNQQFQHLQVKFAWLDALIKKWKAGDGLHIYRGRKSLYVDLEPEDWLKLVKKCTSKIEHPSGFTSLMVYKNMYNFVEIHVKLNEMDCSDFEMLLSEWNSGNGDVLSNGLKKIAVKMDLATLRWLHIKQRSNAGRIFVHRNKNSRLMVEEIDRFPGWVGARISVLDHEIVSDWNLSLLFDSMEV